MKKLLFILVLLFASLTVDAQNLSNEDLLLERGYEVVDLVAEHQGQAYYLLKDPSFKKTQDQKELVSGESVHGDQILIAVVLDLGKDDDILPYEPYSSRGTTEVLDPAFIQQLNSELLQRLKIQDVSRIRVLYFDRESSYSIDPITLPEDKSSPIVSLSFFPLDGRGVKWFPSEYVRNWNEEDERNSIGSFEEHYRKRQSQREDVAEVEEVRRNRTLYERELELSRQKLIQDAKERYQDLDNKRHYISDSIWSRFFQYEQLKRIYYSKAPRVRKLPLYKAFSLAFFQRYSRSCLGDVTSSKEVHHIIQFSMSSATSVESYRLQTFILSNELPKMLIDRLNDYAAHTYTEDSRFLLSQVENRDKDQGETNLPLTGLESPVAHIVRANYDAQLWFSLFACDSTKTKRMFNNLWYVEFSDVAIHSLFEFPSSSMSKELAFSAADLRLNSDGISVHQSCMNYYAFHPVRDYWCRCLDQRLANLLLASDIGRGHYLWQQYSNDFRSLLRLGDIKPRSSPSGQLDEAIFDALTQCDRTVL